MMPWPGPRPVPAARPRPARHSRLIERLRRSRLLGWDRSPLRRRIDRAEAAMIAAVIGLFLFGAPALAVLAGHWIGAAGTRQQRAEESWRQVTAIVEGSTQRDATSGPAGTVEMLARWTAPNGGPRSGWIPVSRQAAAGSNARLWVSPSGRPTGPPLSLTQLQGRSAITEVMTVYVLALLLGFAGHAGVRLLARRRLADWDRAWQAVEPLWSRQR
jgi:hypothetical protein